MILRLNDRELALLKERMEASGLNCSELLRRLITGATIKTRDDEKMRALLAQISKMGSNINQIARIANSMQHLDASMLTTASFQIGEAWRLVKEMSAWR
jgi:hypothetical protein